ncbi:hypothetical protein FRB93_009906 [Tulasnella sp. JGI-2019a]|nr:hypothetical protein FRB93_009906 [Tulasnella sp. JGI-2019a]
MVEVSDNAYLVSPWMEHGDLSKFLTARLEYLSSSTVPEHAISNPFSTFDEAKTIHGIIAGLEYLHINGVVHGDLQASNILLDDSLTPLISDFGMARTGEFNVVFEEMRGAGMARWTCPSLADGSPRTKKTDMFSLGMTIVEVLTGRVPFPHMNYFRVQVAFVIGHRPPFMPARQNGKDLIPLWKVAASCWDVNPMDRPSVDDIASRMAELIYSPHPSSQSTIVTVQDAPSPTACASPDRDLDPTKCLKTSTLVSKLVKFVAVSASSSLITDSPEVLDDPPTGIPVGSGDCKDGKVVADGLAPVLSIQTASNPDITPIPVDRGMHRLSVCKSKSHSISILPPGKPIQYGNCDLYKGCHCDGGGEVALAMKRLRVLGDTAVQAEMVQKRLEREAKIWHDLDHVNILPFCGMFVLSGDTFLVSPWMDRGDLSTFLAHRSKYLDSSIAQQSEISDATLSTFLQFDEAKTIHGIASGLAYLHSKHVIHGDLKAANILLNDDMTPLICDFGTTKNDEFNATFEGMRGTGTARWKCPTLLDGSPRSRKTDVFAFGMTIVEVLTGRVPFHDLTDFKATMALVCGVRPPFQPISRNGKDFRPLWELATSCWKENPDDRKTSKVVCNLARFIVRTVASVPSLSMTMERCSLDDSAFTGLRKRQRSSSPDGDDRRSANRRRHTAP